MIQSRASRSRLIGEGTTATAITPPTIIETLPTLEIRDRYLEIHDRKSREVVTTIELLTPRNKAARSQGREQFTNKRNLIFSTQTHWIEIDLLRAGERPHEVEAAGKSDYYTLLRRAETGGRLEVWYTDIRDRLPTIAVPLREAYPDATLDLQAILNTIYERARYADEIDSAQPVPSPSLRPADAAWAAERVRHWLAARQERDQA